MRALKFLNQLNEESHHIPPIHKPNNQPKPTIMIVDDMQVNLALLGKVLKSAGYETIEARSGKEAISLIQQGTIPAVIITDIEMPQYSGIQMVEVIRSMGGEAHSIPIIAASGNADADMEMDCYDAGCDVFMSKPFNLEALRSKVAELVKPDLRNQPEKPEPKRNFFGKKTPEDLGPPNEFNTKN